MIKICTNVKGNSLWAVLAASTGISKINLAETDDSFVKGISKKAEATACAAETLYLERKLSVQEISDKLSISKKTLYAYLRHRNAKANKISLILVLR